MRKGREIERVRKCQRGDRNAMDALIRQYEKPVFNVAFRMLGNGEEAADVTQTTFLRVFEKLDQFDQRRRLFSWIYRIAVNEAINELNRRKHRAPLPDMPAVSPDSPHEAAVASELRHEVQVVLMELKQEHRAVIALRYFTECSYSEIGDILGVPEKTVKSRLFTARKELRQHLQQHGMLSS